jgi:hypothetical protein
MPGVPGKGGRIPKRVEARMGHRSKAEKEAVAQVPLNAPLVEQPPPDEGWHPLGLSWYQSLAASGQSLFFEPADWEAAKVAAGMITKLFTTERVNAQLFSATWAAMNDLLSTEGSRRRLKLELERTGGDKKAAQAASSVATIAQYRKDIAG